MFKYLTIILSFLAFITYSSISFAQDTDNTNSSAIPTRVSADTMNYDSANSTVTFTGEVEIQRAEFMLWAENITVYLNSAEQSNDPMASLQSGEITRIIAQDDVRMKYGNNSGSCGRAIYEASDALLIMQENPVLKEGVNSLTGEEIRYYMQQNRSEVIGGNKRVEAIFSSQDGFEF